MKLNKENQSIHGPYVGDVWIPADDDGYVLAKIEGWSPTETRFDQFLGLLECSETLFFQKKIFYQPSERQWYGPPLERNWDG